LDFVKFSLLLDRQSLWFPRTDQFEDPLEGTYTDAEVGYLCALDALNVSHDAHDAAPGFLVSDRALRGPKYMRASAYVSCWRAGAGQSMAMWDLYGKGSGAIAVKSTVGYLKQAIMESPLRIFLGWVNYVDWNNSSSHPSTLAMCFRKDSSYEHEKEVRAVIWDQDQISRNMSDALVAARSRSDYPDSGEDPFILRKEDGVRGIEVPFASEKFITEVVIGPREVPAVEGLVESILKRYNLKIKMTVSDRLRPR
jgi:hypothetical protein